MWNYSNMLLLFFCWSDFIFFLHCWSVFVSAGQARPVPTSLVTTLIPGHVLGVREVRRSKPGGTIHLLCYAPIWRERGEKQISVRVMSNKRRKRFILILTNWHRSWLVIIISNLYHRSYETKFCLLFLVFQNLSFRYAVSRLPLR